MVVKAPITAEAFEAIAEELGSCELVRGEVVRMSPAGFDHSRIAARVTIRLGKWAGASKLGRVISGEAGIVVERGPDTVRGADVAYVSYARVPKGTRSASFLIVPPELVVEVMGGDKTWRVAVEKTGEYLRMGVERVWVVEPTTQRLHIFRADGEPLALHDGDTIRDEALLPGFACPVAELFED